MIRLLLTVTVLLSCFNDSVFFPVTYSSCPQNMTSFRINNSNETVCDCDEGFLYYLPLDRCFLPFRQGPCKNSQYLILQEKSDRASCARNPCKKDGLVPFDGNCSQLWKNGFPCGTFEFLNVNGDFALRCEMGFDTRHIIDAPFRECPKGSKRTARGICRKVISPLS